MYEKGNRLLTIPYAMVMAKTLGIEPDTNVYYDSALKQGPHGLPRTIHTDIGSLLYEVFLVFTIGLWQLLLPASLLGWFRDQSSKEE
jgi:hypothetical protein